MTESRKAELRKTERGNALVYVFVGIALFGALMFVFSRGASQNTGAMTKQQSIIQAQAVIDYGSKVASGVDKLISKGISESDLSFETDVFKTKANAVMNPASRFPNCTNEACKVFNPAGGGVIAQTPGSLGTLDPSAPPQYPLPGGLYPHVVRILDVGTPLPELVLTFHNIPKQICAEINNLLHHNFTENPPTGESTTSFEMYTGTFPTGVILLGDGNDEWAKGQTSYCYRLSPTSPDIYAFQVVALVR